jgi:dimethylhistidine N-methyltransferase
MPAGNSTESGWPKPFNFIIMNEKSAVAFGDMRDEILSSLQKSRKSIPSKYFYDERGSLLFDQITHLEEYYLTRAEREIMQHHIGEITGVIGNNSVLIEPGSGSCEKMRLLLDHLPELKACIPVDISREYLGEAVQELRRDYPSLLVKPVCADYTKPFQLPDIDISFDYYVVFYPGSTIGNFQPFEAKEFLGMLSEFMVPGGGLLIGVDLQKDKQIIEAAYNDSEGITAAFNKNVLLRMNRELEGDFGLDKFTHLAFYNEEKGRLEMHLQSRGEQTAQIAGTSINFQDGETIHTENSYKYSLEGFRALAADWFTVEKVWMDERELFSLQYLVKK